MSEQNQKQAYEPHSELPPGAVLGPTGQPLTIEDLPPPGTKRWVVRRKAEVVAGVRGGLITLEEACDWYDLSLDEFRSWQRLFDSHGMRGLRTTRVKQYRSGSLSPAQARIQAAN